MTIFATAIALASWYHDFLPHAQALVRAASVPLAVTGLAVLAQPLAGERLPIVRAGLVSAAVLLSMHTVFFVAGQATTTGVLLMVGLAVATVLARAPERFSRDPLFTVALLAFITGQFMYLYVDYGQIRRVGPIPASALVLVLRLVFSSITLITVLGVVRTVLQTLWRPALAGPQVRLKRGHHVGFETLGRAWLIAIQLAYYRIDLFTDFRLRAIHVAVVVIAVVGLAALVRSLREARVTFGHIAIAGVFGLASIQFTTFYIDYVTEFQARGSAEVEGNMKGAFESVIERTRERPAPDLYGEAGAVLLRRAVLEVLPDQTPPRGSAAAHCRRRRVQTRSRSCPSAGQPRDHEPDPADRRRDRPARRERRAEGSSVAQGAGRRAHFLDSRNRAVTVSTGLRRAVEGRRGYWEASGSSGSTARASWPRRRPPCRSRPPAGAGGQGSG